MVEAFRSRRLDHVEFPYVYLDATYLKVRNSVSQVASMTMVVATGVTSDGNRHRRTADRRGADHRFEWAWEDMGEPLPPSTMIELTEFTDDTTMHY